jgi:hypothetical protein
VTQFAPYMQTRGNGTLWLGGVAVADASYSLALMLDPDGQVYEVTGAIIAAVDPGSGYVLERDDGRRLGCTLTTRLGMPQYFTVETAEVPDDA